jgi:hypothetical protein
MVGAARIVSLAGALCIAFAAPASALGISLSAASVGTLAPGTTATGPVSTVTVSGLPTDPWALRADATNSGRMTRSGLCGQGVTTLASRLHMAVTRTLATTTIDRPSYDVGSAANPVIAHGSTPDTVNVVYSQAVAASELLVTGCSYSVTLTFTVSSS